MTQSAAHPVVIVNELNFEEEVERSPLPVLIDVSAAWCAPCKVARPVVHELAQKHLGEIKVVEIDGGESPLLAAQLGVHGFPTFLGVSRGRIVQRKVGFGGRRPLDEMAQSLLTRTE